MRVLRYRGTERWTGARQQLLDDLRLEGPIPVQLTEARQAILELSRSNMSSQVDRPAGGSRPPGRHSHWRTEAIFLDTFDIMM